MITKAGPLFEALSETQMNITLSGASHCLLLTLRAAYKFVAPSLVFTRSVMELNILKIEES